MLDPLKFVQGAVAKKDFVPALTHFHIHAGRIMGFNGNIALSSPIDMDLDIAPKAVPFIKAIQTCRGTIQMHMTPNRRLAIRSGSFRAYVECLEDEEYPDVGPEGQTIELDGELLSALRTLDPFIADDASRPWARGILFKEGSAFATNNIALVQYWLGYDFPLPINIPKGAVKELLRIGEEPTHLQVAENSVTFHFAGDRWLRSNLSLLEWPDLSKVLDVESDPQPLPEGFFTAVEDLVPFVDELERMHFLGDKLATQPDPDSGASVDLPGAPDKGCFHYRQLMLLKGVADSIDFGPYPSPCPFFGKDLRGAMAGMRV